MVFVGSQFWYKQKSGHYLLMNGAIIYLPIGILSQAMLFKRPQTDRTATLKMFWRWSTSYLVIDASQKKTLENLQDVFRPTVGCRYVQMFFVGFFVGSQQEKSKHLTGLVCWGKSTPETHG